MYGLTLIARNAGLSHVAACGTFDIGLTNTEPQQKLPDPMAILSILFAGSWSQAPSRKLTRSVGPRMHFNFFGPKGRSPVERSQREESPLIRLLVLDGPTKKDIDFNDVVVPISFL